jgi:hypothetical protein
MSANCRIGLRAAPATNGKHHPLAASIRVAPAVAVIRAVPLFRSLLRHTGKKSELVPSLCYRCLLLAQAGQLFLNQTRESFLSGGLSVFVYSSVIRTVLRPAIFDASALDPPTSRRHVIFAGRKECGSRPGKPQPSAPAARFKALRTSGSHSMSPLPFVRTETHLFYSGLSAAALAR